MDINNIRDAFEKRQEGGGERKVHKKAIIVIAIIVVLIGLFFGLARFFTNWMWFAELDYTSVFFKKLLTQIAMGVPTFVIVTLLVHLYFRKLKKGYYKHINSKAPDRNKLIKGVSWAMSLLFGAGLAYVSAGRLWFLGLQFFNAQSVGKSDPIFGLDASFYLFKLDFIKDVNSLLIMALFVLLVMTLIFYAVLISTRAPQVFDSGDDKQASEGADPFKEDDGFDMNERLNEKDAGNGGFGDIFGKMRNDGSGRGAGFDSKNIHELLTIGKRELSVVLSVLFLMIAIHFFLQQFELLHSDTGTVYGAGWTDIHVTLWMYRALILLSLIGMVTSVIATWKKSRKHMLIVPVIMLAVGIAGMGIGVLVQNFVVSPDEISKETTYIERNIDFTQYAYNLADVDKRSFSASNDLTTEDIQNNEATLSNIRINDYLPTQKYYDQTQSIRQYYTFNDVDVDRYDLEGDYTQTFLATREIDESKISDTWVNRHLKYTHGYGVALSRVDTVTESGQPDVLIGSIPPVSEVDNISITQPEIYFGELTNDYVLVNTDEEEFDYPDGDDNKYTEYEGTAGIKMNFINRALFSIREKSLKLLVSSNVNSDSRIIINRNVKERVEEIMPYLQYDDPYMCTVDGKLYWIIDAYTTSSNFPYSQPYAEDSSTNYIRNSVKVVIDAYNGDTNYYIVDDTDAIAKTYSAIYPKLFKDLDEMPEGLQAHIRYPSTMLDVQATIYEKYHVSDVKVFYQKEDMWDISNEIYGTEETAMEPNYYIMKLPGEEDEEFVNTIPFTPKDKKNLTGLLVARNDAEHYGEMVLFQLPKSKVVYGPMQVEAMIDQSTEISKEFSLWNSSGSTYSRGNMFIIPVEDSLLYVEPVYLEATNSSIPEVKRVIVVYGDKIAYEATLGEALESLFGSGAGSAASTTVSTDDSGGESDANTEEGTESEKSQSEMIQDAQDAYDNAMDAIEGGDWEKFGEYMNQLEENLNNLTE